MLGLAPLGRYTITQFPTDGAAGSAVGQSNGTGTATGVGASTWAAAGSAAGSATATGVGVAYAILTGTAAGSGSAIGIGTGVVPGAGSVAGLGTAYAKLFPLVGDSEIICVHEEPRGMIVGAENRNMIVEPPLPAVALTEPMYVKYEERAMKVQPPADTTTQPMYVRAEERVMYVGPRKRTC